ncbi:MAG: hypothetical protein ACLP01_20535 [Solirubrobacteraceae bacterium]
MAVLVGGDRFGDVGVQAAALETARFEDREKPFDGAVPVDGLVSTRSGSASISRCWPGCPG